MSDKERQIFLSWYNHQERRDECLLPHNLPDSVLEFLVSDCMDEMKFGGEVVTIATLLLKSHVEGAQSVEISEANLKVAISAYSQHLKTEWLSRKKAVNLTEKPGLDSILVVGPAAEANLVE